MRRELTWDANNSSSSCSVCQRPFGRLTQRKHHCRHCGRLVCQQCSPHRMVLPSIGEVQEVNGTTASSSSGQGQEAVRVCTPCQRVLLAKEEKQRQQLKQIDRKIELLRMTSVISTCLIDVYFLDGACKTICYDDSTTVEEIALSFSNAVRLALFEVEQDVFNPNQFSLLLNESSIQSVVKRWADRQWRYAKLVIPVHDSRGVLGSKQSVTATAATAVAGRSTTKTFSSPQQSIPKTTSSTSLHEDSLSGGSPAPLYGNGNGFDDLQSIASLRGTSVDETVMLQREIERLQGELERSTAKLETWRAIFKSLDERSVSMSMSFAAPKANAESAPSLAESTSSVALNELATNKEIEATSATSSAAPERRGSFFRRFSSNSRGKPVADSVNIDTNQTATAAATATYPSTDKPIRAPPVVLSKSSMNKISEEYLTHLTEYSLTAQTHGSNANQRSRSPVFNAEDEDSSADNDNDDVESEYETRRSSFVTGNSKANSSSSKQQQVQQPMTNTLDAIASSASAMVFGVNDVEKGLLLDPTRFFREDDSKAVLFTRTFYHHIDNLEQFLFKYDRFFVQALAVLTAGTIPSLTSNETPLSVITDANASLWISSLYHMISTMDTLYEQCVICVEHSRPLLRKSLFRAFRGLIRLPLRNINALKCVMHCLYKESLLFADDDLSALDMIHSALQQSLEMSLFSDLFEFLREDSAESIQLFSDGDNDEEPRLPLTTLLQRLSQSDLTGQHAIFASLQPVMMERLAKNIITTLDCVLAELHELFPTHFEHDLGSVHTQQTNSISAIAIFHSLTTKAFDGLIKPYYRYLHSDNKLPATTALSLFLFVSQFAGRLDAFGDVFARVELINWLETTTDTSASVTGSGLRENASSNTLANLAPPSPTPTPLHAELTELQIQKWRIKTREKWRIKQMELLKVVLQMLTVDVQLKITQRWLSTSPTYSSSSSSSSSSLSSLATGLQRGHEILPSISVFVPFLKWCEEYSAEQSLSIGQLTLNPSAAAVASTTLNKSLTNAVAGQTLAAYPEFQWWKSIRDLVMQWTTLIVRCDSSATMSHSSSSSHLSALQSQSSSSPTSSQDVRAVILSSLLDALMTNTVGVHSDWIHSQLFQWPVNGSSSDMISSVEGRTLLFVACVHSHVRFAQFVRSWWDSFVSTRLLEHGDGDVAMVDAQAEKWKAYAVAHKQMAMKAVERFVDVSLSEIQQLMDSAQLFQSSASSPLVSTTSALSALFKSSTATSSITSAGTGDPLLSTVLHSWDQDVTWICSLKRLLSCRCLAVCGLFDESILDYLLHCTVEETALRLIYHVLQSLVQIYFQRLMSDSNVMHTAVFRIPLNNNGTNGPQHDALMQRMCEDLHLLSKLIEEVRTVVVDSCGELVASIGRRDRSGSSATLTSQVSTALSTATATTTTTTTTSSSTRQVQWETYSSTSGKSHKGEAGGGVGGNGVSHFLSQQQQSQPQQPLYNKQAFDKLAQPLLHVSLLFQLMFRANHVVNPVSVTQFVCNELTKSFGDRALSVWQLACTWRGDKRDVIIDFYETHLKSQWKRVVQCEVPSRSLNVDLSLDISFLSTVKAANIISSR